MRSEAQHQSCVHRVIDAMKERLDRPFRLEEMAEVAIMSPFHFVRVFREVTGLPPRRFLTALRLSAAKRLLISSDLSVTEVSLEVGYNSLGTFTRRFTEVVGASPMRFRHLAWSDSGEAIRSACRWRARSQIRPHGPGLEARLLAPEEASDPVFVGLFLDAVPQGAPLGCAVLHRPGRFWLSAVPDGTYHLLAVGLPGSGAVREILLNEGALRGGALGRRVTVREARFVGGVPTIELREAEVFDPPILAALPLLLARHATARTSGGPGGVH